MVTDISKANTAGDLRIRQGTPAGLADTFRDYGEYKRNLDFELKANAEGFVRIGYLLKVARDTDILRESGYKNVAEFAQGEYGLTKDIVSRYIAINDRYSEDGYSDRLMPQFENFGVAKLAEMLTLPDSVIEEIKPGLTKSDIREIKKEVAEEEAITPLEVAIEATTARAVKEDADYPLPQRVWKNYFEAARENYKALGASKEYRKFWEDQSNAEAEREAAKALTDILAPNGDAVLWSRVPGVGKIMISFAEGEDEITMTNIRTNEKTRHSITSVLSDIMDLFGAMAKAEWEDVYGEPFEAPKAPAPAAKPEPKPEPKPAKKEVKPAAKPEKTPAKTEAAPAPVPEPSEKDEPIKEYQTKLITHLDDVQIGDKVVNTSNGEEGTVLGIFNGEDLKVSTNHGIILVSVPSYEWSILEPEPETPGEGNEEAAEAAGSNVGDLSEVAPAQQDGEDEEGIRGLRDNIFECEHELEEVFEDAYADGLTVDGLKSCLIILENLRHQMERMLRYKVMEEAKDDED